LLAGKALGRLADRVRHFTKAEIEAGHVTHHSLLSPAR
jgi:hypothetical protein